MWKCSMGENILHDTVDIAYQFGNDAEDGNEDENENPGRLLFRKVNRCETMNLDVEPYQKNPKMVNSKVIPFTDERRWVESYVKSRHDDVKWMISFAFSKEAQLMWVGGNAKKEIRSKNTTNLLPTTD